MSNATDYVSLMGPANDYVNIMGADEYVNIMGGFGAPDYASGASAFMMLAQVKQALAVANTALKHGNCGAANEAMGTAWNAFGDYAPLAARTGQSPYATSIFKTTLAQETRIAKACGQTNGFGCAGLGCGDGLGMFDSMEPAKKKLLIGGGIAAGVLIAFLALRK